MLERSTLVQRCARAVGQLRAEILDAERRHTAVMNRAAPGSAASSRNFLHYLTLRQCDLRRLQEDLSRLGLSSLGRAESHVLYTIDSVLRALEALGATRDARPAGNGAPSFDEGRRLLAERARALLGPRPCGRDVHIMVTLPSEAAEDARLVGEMVARGMDLARINCARDDPERWTRMVRNVRLASGEGRPCRIQMDLGGRKLRTGACARELSVRPADIVVLTRSQEPGGPAVVGPGGEVREARVPCSLPAALDALRAGERVLIDDGKIGGVVESVTSEGPRVRITSAKPTGSLVRADRGINLPDTHLGLRALTDKDRMDLEHVVKLADVVGLSFVQGVEDVADLEAELERLGAAHLGLVLKIETRAGFDQLPGLLLHALGARPVGIMIARGDMAVECGYERLAEIQEEMLWLCEAAHVPVIWATQVLDRLAREGLPTRAEITDAAMGERAECVMLNKGPFVLEAIQLLDHILKRMQSHQHKKSATLSALPVTRGGTWAEAAGSGGELRARLPPDTFQENPMGEIINKTKGKIKQAVGALTGNRELEREGQRDELAGKVKGAIADVKDAAKDAGHKIKEAVK